MGAAAPRQAPSLSPPLAPELGNSQWGMDGWGGGGAFSHLCSGLTQHPSVCRTLPLALAQADRRAPGLVPTTRTAIDWPPEPSSVGEAHSPGSERGSNVCSVQQPGGSPASALPAPLVASGRPPAPGPASPGLWLLPSPPADFPEGAFLHECPIRQLHLRAIWNRALRFRLWCGNTQRPRLPAVTPSGAQKHPGGRAVAALRRHPAP